MGTRNRRAAVAFALVAALSLAHQPAARAADAEAPGGPNEGIRIRGEWTIEVRNPDGSLASRHEFKNALVPGQGDAILARLLGRTQVSPWAWSVDVGEVAPVDASGTPCAPSTTPPNGIPCSIRETNGLTVAVDGGTVRLSGAVTAAKAAPQLSRFATRIDWLGGGAAFFTEKRLPAPIPVAAGQIIQITVVFSFSSGA